VRLKLAHGLALGRSPINGKGCFSTVHFQSRKKIAEYTGERISDLEARRRSKRRKLRICGIDENWSLDGSRGGNGTHYINHSCSPNAFMRSTRGHILFFALRDIYPGEEITVDYGTTLHKDSKKCFCGASLCRGTINRK
jgi:SET domain-containing protein